MGTSHRQSRSSESLEHNCDPFGSTQWSVVLEAGREGSASRAALEELCRAYWFPVFAYVRRRVPNAEDARDLTQGFFADLLDRKAFAAADPSRGRFRGFLITALKNYLSNEHAKARALKRGGGRVIMSLDLTVAESRMGDLAVDRSTPEQEFERRWAVALLDRVITRLEQEQSAAGKATQFETLRLFLTGQNAGRTCAEVARQWDVREEAVRSAVYRLRKRYRSLLREEILGTVATEDEVEDELRRLFEALDT